MTLIHSRAGSLADNTLCYLLIDGYHQRLLGSYRLEGIIALCEGLKGTAVTSLECAAPRRER